MANLELIKKVRQLTGAGMVDVKQALVEANDDETKAIEILRKAGQKIAEKKSDRKSAEGVIALASAVDKLAMVILTCETDFVARNQNFIQAAQSFADRLLTTGVEEFTIWANQEIKDNLIVKIGENLTLGKAEVIKGQIIGNYLHSNKKLAAVVVLKSGSAEIAREVAMHVAAMSPKYLRPENVPAEIIAKEKEIITEQLKNEGKPEAMMAKISEGKLQKFYTEVCLLKQAYIKDDKISIEEFLANHSAEIENFYYFNL